MTPRDRRIGKAIDSNGDGTVDTTERYVWDGSDLVLVLDGSGAVTTRYLYDPSAARP